MNLLESNFGCGSLACGSDDAKAAKILLAAGMM